MRIVRERIASKAWQTIRAVLSLLGYIVRRFVGDNGPQIASSLTYTSLLGLVPLLAMLLAVLSAFPGFEDMREDVKAAVLSPLLPDAGGEVRRQIDQFLANTRQLGVVGLIGLMVTSLLLLNTIETAFNRIWRVEENRPLLLRVVAFWAILTLTPVLIGTSLTLSARLVAFADEAGLAAELAALGGLIAFLLQASAFTLLFVAIPARRVRVGHALAGGIVSALLFDVLKWAFGAYLASAGTYQVIYGALATIPIFLLWLYLSWMVILVGAQIAAAIPEWHARRTAPPVHTADLSPGETLALGLAVLGSLWHMQQDRTYPTREAVQAALAGAAADVDDILRRLIGAGWVSESADGALLLGRDLAEVDLYALEADLGLTERVTGSFRERLAGAGPAAAIVDRLAAVLDRVDGAKRDAMRFTVKELVRPPAEPSTARGSAAE